MRVSFRALLLAACLLALPGGAFGAPDDPKPPANDDCLACHGDPEAKRADGSPMDVAANVFEASKHGPMTCIDCHADLAKLAEFPHPDKLAKVNCASCHDEVGLKYLDSIHARARLRAGLIVAPSCSDCHGKHDIKGKDDTSSRVISANVAATCGKCHTGIQETFDRGIHAAEVKKGNSHAPTCVDCHTAHSIQRADTDQWRLAAAEGCGTCHANVVESFRRTFHGKVTQLGFTRVAACADCHGAHDILPAANPASMVSSARLVETCKTCHAGANASFVQYDPHPDPRNYERSPVLWWLNGFYTVLIGGCFGFFGLHSVLWFFRSRREQKEKRS